LQIFLLWEIVHSFLSPFGVHKPTLVSPFTQNHGVVGVGRDLWRSPSPTPCQSRVT